MIGFSQTTGYAIQALACLAGGGDRLVQAKEIAACTRIPGPYLSKILNTLVRAGLLRSKRGYRGGVELVRPPERICLVDIAAALEGDEWLPECLLGLGMAQDDCCPLAEFWKETRTRIQERLKELTLRDIMRFMEERGRTLAAPCDDASVADADDRRVWAGASMPAGGGAPGAV